MAWNAGILTLVGTLIIFGITFWLIRSTSTTESTEVIAPKIYGMRSKYFVLLILIIVVTLFATLRGLPYFPPSDAPPAYTVSVAGTMWNWEVTGIHNNQDNLPSDAVLAGKTVEFVITAGDVNHGLGIYNAQGQIISQTQAMPGYPSKLYVTFNEPGTYQLICMEYCGAGHQSMTSEFIVANNP